MRAGLAVCAVAPDDPWRVCRPAASLGGDCDTIAATVGAIIGACHGVERFPAPMIAALLVANPDLALEPLADDLLASRGRIETRPVLELARSGAA